MTYFEKFRIQLQKQNVGQEITQSEACCTVVGDLIKEFTVVGFLSQFSILMTLNSRLKDSFLGVTNFKPSRILA